MVSINPCFSWTQGFAMYFYTSASTKPSEVHQPWFCAADCISMPKRIEVDRGGDKEDFIQNIAL